MEHFWGLHELQVKKKGGFLLLHGVQTSCEDPFFKGGGSCNSESRRKSDFSLFLSLQKRVEILGLFFRMRVFYLRCL